MEIFDNQDYTIPASLNTRGILIPLDDFDWENELYIQTSFGPLYLPWKTGANTTVPIAHNNDMKRANGWELIYNDFGEINSINPLLVFYNTPRGILRVYCYTNNILSYGNSFFYDLILKSTIQNIE